MEILASAKMGFEPVTAELGLALVKRDVEATTGEVRLVNASEITHILIFQSSFKITHNNRI